MLSVLTTLSSQPRILEVNRNNTNIVWGLRYAMVHCLFVQVMHWTTWPSQCQNSIALLGTPHPFLCPVQTRLWINMLQLNSMIEIGKGTQIQMFQFIPIYIFRIEILQTIPNGESALVVVRWVLNLNLPWYHARSILKSLCPTLSILWIRNQINNGYPRYVDQGSQAMLDISQLRHLASEFRTVPCQAVPAALAGVCPLQGDWTPEDNYWFNTRYQETFNLNKSFIIAGLLVSSLREKL